MCTGSSPLTRGKHVSGRRSTAGGRLIPAHAGKTQSLWGLRGPPRAHPRSRGENGPAPGMVPTVVGSSPLTRGKRGDDLHSRVAAGLIPAHAGKTHNNLPPFYAVGAHPRSRGENRLDGVTGGNITGSSPLTRGKLCPPRRASASTGLIPAHAGKTTACSAARPAGRAHPRSRGENIWGSPTAGTYKGSSPLTRGKHDFELRVRLLVGLIPAHAGKTTSR